MRNAESNHYEFKRLPNVEWPNIQLPNVQFSEIFIFQMFNFAKLKLAICITFHIAKLKSVPTYSSICKLATLLMIMPQQLIVIGHNYTSSSTRVPGGNSADTCAKFASGMVKVTSFVIVSDSKSFPYSWFKTF